MPPPAVESVTRAVRRLWNDPRASIHEYTVDTIDYTSWSRSSAGLSAVRGAAYDGEGAKRDWQLVVKELRHRRWQPTEADLSRQIDDGGDGPGDWGYWRREPLLRESGLLDRLPERFATPRCLEIERVGGRIRLWLERADGRPGDRWTRKDLLSAAADLGSFHALHRNAPPHRDWFCRPFLEQSAVRSRAALIERVAAASTNADRRLRQLFPAATVSALERLWRHHPAAVAALRAGPTTLVHRDLIPGNLFRRESGTVALDWGQVGVGPAGEDLATLVLASAVAQPLSAEDLDALGARAAASHAEGLAAGGAMIEPEFVHRDYLLTAAFHYGLPMVRTAAGLLAMDPAARESALQDGNVQAKVERMTHHVAAVQPYLSGLANIAR